MRGNTGVKTAVNQSAGGTGHIMNVTGPIQSSTSPHQVLRRDRAEKSPLHVVGLNLEHINHFLPIALDPCEKSTV